MKAIASHPRTFNFLGSIIILFCVLLLSTYTHDLENNLSSKSVSAESMSFKGELKNIEEQSIFNFSELPISKNSAYGDEIGYINSILGRQTLNTPPYNMRFIHLSLVRGVAGVLNILPLQGKSIDLIYLSNRFLNIIYIFIILSCFWKMTNEIQNTSLRSSLLIVAVVNLPILLTYNYIMVMICGIAFLSAALLFLHQGHNKLALLFFVISIWANEINIIASLLIFASRVRVSAKSFWIAAIVVATSFLAVRLYFGSDPLSLNYGWKVSQGEFNLKYLISHKNNLDIFISKFLMSFGIVSFICLLICLVQKQYALCMLLITITFTLLISNMLLASRVSRVSGALIPAALYIAIFSLESRRIYAKDMLQIVFKKKASPQPTRHN